MIIIALVPRWYFQAKLKAFNIDPASFIWQKFITVIEIIVLSNINTLIDCKITLYQPNKDKKLNCVKFDWFETTWWNKKLLSRFKSLKLNSLIFCLCSADIMLFYNRLML